MTLRVARAIAFDAARVYRGDRDAIESAGRKPGESEADRLIGFRAVVEVATWTKAVPGQVAVGPKYMRYDARSVSGLPSPFVVGAVQDRSRTAAPLEGATRRIPPSAGPTPSSRWRRRHTRRKQDWFARKRNGKVSPKDIWGWLTAV